MQLTSLTADMLRRAIQIYQDLAYGGARPWREITPLGDGPVEALLGMFHRELVESVPGHGSCRYSLRLGNRNYPFMKLLLQEHLVAGEFFFAVDTHDQMEIGPDYPDHDQWLAVRRFNGELKNRIEQAFERAGLDTAAAVRRQIAAACGPAGMSCRGLVLVVDDERDLAMALAALLQRRGFRTCVVHDGRAGVAAAREIVPDLVLCDYELPELDGLQVIAALRADPATSRVPVLLSSAARLSLADIARADGFLKKPFPESLLDEMLDRVLRAREARR